ncbi:MAG: hypothetical protein COZ46_04385 [Verrucomicrobia bacterium CG_4_10_14_3_um_filter_43_23]|nr:MAG: hypothetical protein AUJ82_08535 [Verrucomicrobia bacterium CG1_02_43_26]PIP58528.1 MAG: hypothetical protein COX01_08415 [Verrucomicrobia bacterium CG22_combo_CG10-13_8_21_14_all_43_17]PIX58326.1 MAG: hypothetical protein COZ46_04385 [Verrucomicrobia bacterium CG_4_10_14_3_um_filter_43_23]PIY60853.1 MAG: hypothetical protein COY94_08435 [Verrucomicrobia bacterium CG_4_10_14_0_8_um_filter_43_34]PJA44343.1 MAG: hypothetical protein CO175_03400 [Verrucomicrobia bacterium CG_4_9_14_3_um_fi
MKANKARIIVVDDDFAGLEFMSISLEMLGLDVSKACSVKEAKKIIEKSGIHTFECVLTDFRMPEESGLDLLEWVQLTDPALSTIIITAEGEKDLVQRSLRGGALDFLEKPINRKALQEAISNAIETTRKKRATANITQGVKEAGQYDQIFKAIRAREVEHLLKYFFHPLSDVGGDFINVLKIAEKKFLILAGDVSGHDIRAAFVSAYFQGLARGLLKKSASIEEIVSYFNTILNREWANSADQDLPSTFPLSASLCILASTVDFEANTLQILNCGFPEPFFIDKNGLIQPFKVGYPPLGWIEGESYKEASVDIHPLAYLLAATDGLIELANNLQLNFMSLSYYLLNHSSEKANSILKVSTDDVLIFKFQLAPELTKTERYFPLVYEVIPGNEFQIIDFYQEKWEKSLKLIFEDRLGAKLDDILHGAREAALLSLTLSCEKLQTKLCSLQMVYCEALNNITVYVRDPDAQITDQAKRAERIEAKRKAIASLMEFSTCSIEEAYASIKMEFQLDLLHQNT